jgi:hypothetical protein
MKANLLDEAYENIIQIGFMEDFEPSEVRQMQIEALPVLDKKMKHPERIDWGDLVEQAFLVELLDHPRMRRMYHLTYLHKFASTAVAWCDPDAVDWKYVSKTTDDTGLLRANMERVDWRWANTNPAAVPILKEHPEHLSIFMLTMNPCSQAMDVIEQHMDELGDSEWFNLLQNPAAIRLFDKCPEEYWSDSVVSANPGASSSLDPDVFYDWFFLRKNTNAYERILRHNPDIGSISKNPCMLPLLKKHLNKIDWRKFSKNPNPEAVQILKEHPREIDYVSILKNPNLLTYDYAAMRAERGELMASLAGHPRFVKPYVIENFQEF